MIRLYLEESRQHSAILSINDRILLGSRIWHTNESEFY